jgi:hypothetical protein
LDPGAADTLEDEGILFLDDRLGPESPMPSWYQVTFHTPWYVFEHWGRWFEICGYVPGGALERQDHILLKRTDEAWRLEPIAVRPPREPGELPGAGTSTVRDEIATRRAALSTPSTRLGPTGEWLRRLVLRLMRPYAFHEDRVDEALAGALDELAGRVDAHAERLSALERRR